MIKVCIDPGHGGKDPGAVGNGLLEKDVALDISLKLADKLNEYDVILTRSKDEYVPLSERAAIANEAKVALFVSIHVNASADSSPQGLETWHHPNSVGGKLLAEYIQSAVLPISGLKDRGLKTSGGLYVLRNTNAPAVLVELGFISNAEDAELMKNQKWLDNVADSIALSVKKYFKGDGN